MIHPSSLYPGAIAHLRDGTPVTHISWSITTLGERADAIATVMLPGGEIITRHSRDLFPLAVATGRNPLTQPGCRACGGVRGR